MRKTIFIATLALLSAACSVFVQQSRIAVLQNPETKQTVECKAWGSVYKNQVVNCIKVYQKVGYKLIADSIDNYR
jgi:hypothetical protein